jgi:hypothetical protein
MVTLLAEVKFTLLARMTRLDQELRTLAKGRVFGMQQTRVEVARVRWYYVPVTGVVVAIGSNSLRCE